jgi:hypothetical protein
MVERGALRPFHPKDLKSRIESKPRLETATKRGFLLPEAGFMERVGTRDPVGHRMGPGPQVIVVLKGLESCLQSNIAACRPVIRQGTTPPPGEVHWPAI